MARRYGRREFSTAVRQSALQRAVYRCERCGARHPLEFHHRRRSDPSLFNCIVLCRKCHRQAHQLHRWKAAGATNSARGVGVGVAKRQSRKLLQY